MELKKIFDDAGITFIDASNGEIGQSTSSRIIDIDETEQGRPFLVMESTGGAFAEVAPLQAQGTPKDRADEFVPKTQTPRVMDQAGPAYRDPLYSSRSQTRTTLLWSAAVLGIATVGVILMAGLLRTSEHPGYVPPATASNVNQDSSPSQLRTDIPAAAETVPAKPAQSADVVVPSQPVVAAKPDVSRPAERATRSDSKLEIAEAQVRLGQMYEGGLGVTQDDEQAALWYRRAADPGYAPAQNSLGHLYENGRGVPRDYVEAVEWYRKAATQGFAAAQNNLANAYALGRGVPKNEARAVAWYRKAADQGYAVAQANLGWVYQNGRGVSKNESQAVTWYRKAADQGYAPAQNNLADIYEKSGGTARNFTQAVQWYLKAAEQGYAPAQSKLGVIYEAGGQGVEKSLEQAVTWYRKAAAQGYADARKALERLGVAEADL